jgi:hypothetical protein
MLRTCRIVFIEYSNYVRNLSMILNSISKSHFLTNSATSFDEPKVRLLNNYFDMPWTRPYPSAIICALLAFPSPWTFPWVRQLDFGGLILTNGGIIGLAVGTKIGGASKELQIFDIVVDRAISVPDLSEPTMME